MKKFYSFVLALLVATGAQAQVASIGETDYATLDEALAAATEGSVIVLKENVTITKRIDNAVPNLTIQGANQDVTITRGGNIICILGNDKNRGLKIENLTIDGGNVASGQDVIQASNGQVTVNNVTIKNVHQTANNILTQKGGGWMVVNNVKIFDKTLAEGCYDIFTGTNNGLTISGNYGYSIHIQNSLQMKAENYNGISTLYLDNYDSARTVVNGGNAANFELGNAVEYYSLVQSGANVALEYSKPVVENEATGVTYTDFMAAVNALAPIEGHDIVVLDVLENANITDRLGNPNNTIYNIKGATDGITLTRTFNNKLLVSNGRNMFFENITVDCDNRANDNYYEFEVNMNTLGLTNVTVANSASGQGIFTVKDGSRTLSLNNVKVTGFDGTIGVNLNGRLQLAGNNEIPAIRIANAGASITATDILTNTDPIKIIFADGITPAEDRVMVNGCTDPTKFEVEGDWHLESNGEALVLKAGTASSIDSIIADENAPFEYYNLQGIRVENPENGLFIRRQGNKTTKVIVK